MPDVASHLLSEPREVAFELDRFELVDGGLQLVGRWFGVQGRRFMRPSLTLRGDDGDTRLLADLAHKPWAAENGELWRAAFPCDGDLGGEKEAELTVAPDLTVGLAVPDAARTRRRGAEHVGQRPKPQPAVAAARQSVIQDRRQDAAQTHALTSARAEIATLRERLEELGSELKQARARFGRELREAQEATTQALHGRDEANAARRDAIEAREMAEQRIEKALAQRDKAVAQRDKAVTQRSQAVAERDQVVAQRDRAATALKRVGAERNELASVNEQLRHQPQSATAARGAAVTRNGAIDLPGQRRHASRLAVATAVTSLLVAVLVVILILSSS